MPVTIGTGAHTFANPIGLLSDCHRRIEMFLQTLQKVAAEAQGGPLNSKQREALDASLKYFLHAAPKHTADEEEDLFPKLRSVGRPDLQQILARVDRLEHEHRTADEWHREVDEIGQRWLLHDRLSREEILRLEELLSGLSDLYREHIAIEDQEVFPMAQKVLSDSEKTAIGHRMASRRGVPFIPEWAHLKGPENKIEK
ncbi:MAG: hemerythrin domain-containing protein [Bryobacteraceae bacterium]